MFATIFELTRRTQGFFRPICKKKAIVLKGDTWRVFQEGFADRAKKFGHNNAEYIGGPGRRAESLRKLLAEGDLVNHPGRRFSASEHADQLIGGGLREC